MKKFHHLFALPLLTTLSLLNFRCTVFSPVGEALTGAYENTVSYFNSYYNASRAFSDAEDEIHTATQAARGKSFHAKRVFVVSAAAKQKLTVVIDKCSSILSFHPTSSLVDDALLLIGKSYYYQGEYLKAERKFQELVEQYPTSPLILESKLWRSRTLERLNRQEDAVSLLTTLVAEAEIEGEDNIAGDAHLLLAGLYEAKEERERAIGHYRRVTELGVHDDTMVDALVGAGDLFFSSGQFEKASEEFEKVTDYASNLNV